jgi:16S rRNA processing protein RimM
VRGDITAHADGPTLGTLEVGDAVTVRVDGTDRELVLAFRRGDVPKAVISFEGIETRDDVAPLVGGTLMVDAGMLPVPDDDETFYVRDLLGFEVRTGERVLGPVRDVVPGPANDSLSVDGPAGQVLVPFTYDAVVDIDHDDGVILLRDDLLGDWAWGEGE